MFRLAILACVFAASISGYASSKINISNKTTLINSILYSVDKGLISDKNFDANNPLDSYLEFKLEGTFETNYCGFNDFSLQNIYRPNDSSFDISKSYLMISPIATGLNSIEVGEEICTSQCIIKPFSVDLRISVNSWDHGQTVQHWEFIVKDYFREFATIRATLDLNSGWSFTFDQGQTRSCAQHP